MSPDQKDQMAEDVGGVLSFFDGLDEALIGYCYRFGMEPVAIYDDVKVMEILCRDMSEEDAVEWFAHNVLGSWIGDTTPAFLHPCGEPQPVPHQFVTRN